MSSSIVVRTLTEDDAAAWWNLRLIALETGKFSFSKSVEEHRATTIEMTARNFREAPAGDFTLGAFDGSDLSAWRPSSAISP